MVSYRSRVDGSKSLRRKEFGADEYVEKAARFAGFLNTVANNPGKFPGIVKAIRASVFGTRGMGSPHVRNWWKVIARFPSPHRLEKVLWGVKKRAGTIVASYSNRKVGWCHVIDAIIDAGTIRVGRLAVCAVARATFSRDQICTLLWSASSVEGYSLGYRRCRDALTRLGRANVIMRSDDSIVVRAMLASEAIFTCKNGYIVEGYRMEPRQAWVLRQKKNAGYFSRVYLAISGEKWQVYEDLPKNMEIAVDRVATSDVDVVAKYCDGGYGYVPIFFNEVGEQPLRQHYELRCLLKKFHDQPIVTAGQIRKQLDVEAYGNDEVAEFFARCVW